MSVAYFTVVHALFLGSVRYRVPLMPLVDLAAAVGAVVVVSWMSGYRKVDGEGDQRNRVERV